MLENGCILDITGDQFKSDEEFLCYSERVYYGEMDEFHLQDDLDVTIWKKGTFEKIFSFHVNKVHF